MDVLLLLDTGPAWSLGIEYWSLMDTGPREEGKQETESEKREEADAQLTQITAE